MIDHRACAQARYNVERGRWECHLCGEPLGRGGKTLGLVAGLELRPSQHGELRVYGLGDRARLLGKTARTAASSEERTRGGVRRVIQTNGLPPSYWARHRVGLGAVEVYVYCPNRGCGAGQHVRAPAE